jgi:hypothetical protein
MSDPVASPVGLTLPKLQGNQALIVGRIDAVRQFEASGKRVVETRVIQAAADQFSAPSAVAVQSSMKLGQAGDDVKVHVWCTGYRDSYKTKDGEVVQTARNVYRAVE